MSDYNAKNDTKKYLDPKEVRTVVSAVPKLRQQLLKWNGWGYKDSYFRVQDNTVLFSGDRYPIAGEVALDQFKDWVVGRFNADLSVKHESKGIPNKYPDIVESPEFLEEIKALKIDLSIEGLDRLIRCHGQTLHDIHHLRQNLYTRIPDVVLWPVSHEEVVDIVRIASKYEVVLIPYGGGTSVSGAVTCPQNEKRPIAVLDTSQMNRLMWLDKSNLMACFESGILGQDLERVLSGEGLTMGHEPDSHEFSSLGGWVATRASGMKKNVYGNIEDIVIRVKMVTCKGVLEKNICAPRVSCGPDFDHIVMGSEGTLGVITQVIIKVRPLPPVKKYGSLVFPTFENGVRCLREIAKRRCQPASIRLIDNEQFQFGQVLKGESTWLVSIMDKLKKTVLTKVKGFDLKKMVVATLLFEGDADAVKNQEKLIYQIAQQHDGLAAGATNGQKGYVLTFVIAYIRDLALEYGIVAESFETSVAWDRCELLCANVKKCVAIECGKHNIENFMISCRVTQTYDAGACVYFYFGFRYNFNSDPVTTYEEIENKARDEILASGGSISHHHGVGKIRSRWYKQSISEVGVQLYKSTKHELDPKNIFATGNLLSEEDQPTKSKL